MFLRMIVRALFRQKSRMFVALLAVAVGAAIISGMITVYREVPAQLGREFRAYGANVLLLPAGEAKTFDSAALQKAREALAGRDVVGLAPFLYERLEVNKQPVLTGGTDFEEIKKVSPYWMVKGEYPKAGEREILLGAEMASKIARDTDKLIGQTVSVSAGEGKAMLSFTVSGIVSTGGKEEQFAFLNLDELQKIVEKPGAVGLAQLSVVADGDSLKSVEESIRTANIGIEPQEVQQIAHSEFNVLKKLEVLILLVTIIVLILTLICVTTTMTAVVTERRREIGLKKALGASNVNIVMEFLGEGCVLGLVGGLLGSGFGYLFAQSVSINVFSRGIAFAPGIAVLAVMGPSGSGKTTLMNIIGCMDHATSGTVLLDGIDITKVSDHELTLLRRDKIGIVFQQFHMIPYLTAIENIMAAQYYHSIPDKKEALEALDRVGLADRADHLPSQLSGGEQQRVCIARALINYPVLILADEPTGNLDEVNQNLVMKIFRELHAEGHTILTVTHSAEVGAAAERCVIIEHGRMVEKSAEEQAAAKLKEGAKQ